MVADAGAKLAHPSHRLGEIDLVEVGGTPPSKTERLASVVDCSCATNKGLGGDTAGIEAVASEQISFDQGGSPTQQPRSTSADQTGGAGPDRDQVVAVCPTDLLVTCCRVDVVGRMAVGDDLLVIRVARVKPVTDFLWQRFDLVGG